MKKSPAPYRIVLKHFKPAHLIAWFKMQKHEKRKNIVCLTLLILLAIIVGIMAWTTHRPMPDRKYSMTLRSDVALESHALFVGDIYWGRHMYDWSQQSLLKTAYPFSKLNSLQPEIYDAWIGNLECPSDPNVKQPIGYDPGLTMFNCDSSFMPEAAKWFDIVSLANNHTMNQNREAGQAATRTELDKHHIQYFGGFDPHKSTDTCEVVSLPTRLRLDGKQQSAKLPIALCGYHGVYYTVTDKAIRAMQKYAKYMPVIAYPHMGTEYQASADNGRRLLYQKMIDNGADAVLANHPHWVQETEVYKRKLIVYSMGNFIFDQQFSQEVMRSAAFDVVMSLKQGTASEDQLRAWIALGETCQRFEDDCLARAQQQNLSKLPLHFSYDVVGVDTSRQITRRANNRVYQGILERLKWSDVQKQGVKTSDGHISLE